MKLQTARPDGPSSRISIRELAAKSDDRPDLDINPAGARSDGIQPVERGTPTALEMGRFGLDTEAQWLLASPSRFEDLKTVVEDFQLVQPGIAVVVRGRIASRKMYAGRTLTTDPARADRLTAAIVDQKGQVISVVAFGRPGFAWRRYRDGSEIVLRGTPRYSTHQRGSFQLEGAEVIFSEQLGRVHPIYPSVKGAKGQQLAERVNAHLHLIDTAARLVDSMTGWRDEPIVARAIEVLTSFASADELIEQLHRPDSLERGEDARRAAKLLSAWSLVRSASRRTAAAIASPRSVINVSRQDIEHLVDRIPLQLTNDQRKSIDGIAESLRSPLRMDGLMTGDVGTGKTLAFLLPMVAAHGAGRKVVLLTPNLLLIQQVARELASYFPEVPVCTVTGKGLSGQEPAGAIIIGTTALLGAMSKGKLGRLPDFLIVDEQHKFSVDQRQQLLDKHTNTLEVTATPIPRTAALATHGGKDLYILRESPVAKHINTRILRRADALEARNRVLGSVLHRGEQAAVIYPLVESSDPTHGLRTVTDAAKQWASKVPLEQIAVLHGRMKDGEKEETLNALRRGEKRLLLASTVIEVGVTLPELKTMLVLGAENCGVVTLHQLRGRLARAGGEGEFMMFADSPSDDALDRMQMLVDHDDGFTLAEKDAQARGYGDLLGGGGAAQSGATRTLFLGADVGPRELGVAVALFEKGVAAAKALLAVDVANAEVRRGETLRML
ncbi:DEAD/DEAH box helicase [Variovorax sp. LT1P1]|uniref:DEAD/DEAH box helicase n=1 Tax=Variovorax sp. LT1P1 TaxID=3443730 RepID=UPI003F484B74